MNPNGSRIIRRLTWLEAMYRQLPRFLKQWIGAQWFESLGETLSIRKKPRICLVMVENSMTPKVTVDLTSEQARELVKQCDGLTQQIKVIEHGLLHH